MRQYFELDCGRSVTVDAVHFIRTYGGLLEGQPNQRMNDDLISRAVERAGGRLWGTRKVHLIPPLVDRSDPAHPTLPRVELTAWLTCYRPIAEPNAGSELVVVWYRDEFPGLALDGVVYEAIRGLAWEELAEDFEGW